MSQNSEIKIENVGEELLKVLKRAIKQSNNMVLKSKKKVVSTEYDDELKKPMQEITEESEEVTKLKGTVDINSLKVISGLLKDVSGLLGIDNTESDEARGVVVLADVKDTEDEE